MKYRVRIIVTEKYTTWVDAKDNHAAEEIALKQFNNGELFADIEHIDLAIVDVDDGGDTDG